MIRQDWSTLKKLMFMKAAAGGSVIEDTATGNPLTFNTNVAKPLRSLLIPFTPVQSGTGDPSPDNVRPVVGITGLTAWRTGKNVCSIDSISLSKPSKRTTNVYPETIPAGTYIISWKSNATATTSIQFYDELSAGTNMGSASVTASGSATVTLTNPCKRIYAYIANAAPDGATADITDIQIELAETATAFSPYTGESFPVSFPSGQTIYGGTLDIVSGVLSVEWAIVDMGSLRWVANATGTTGIYRMSTSSLSDNIEIPSANSVPGEIVCSAYKTVSADNTYSKVGGIAIGKNKAVTVYDADYNTDGSVDDFITSVTGKMIAYKLATPSATIQLTPEQITALVGDNTIWSDTNGENTAVYLKKA